MRRRTAGLPAIIALAVAALVITVEPAGAEARKNSWEVGFFGGYTFNASELELSSAPQYGLRVGWNFAPAFELEFEYLLSVDQDLQGENSTLIDNPGVFFSDPDRTFETTSYSLRFLINPRNERRRFKPYMLLGLGRLDYEADPVLDASDLGLEDSAMFLFGGGIRQRLGARIYFRAEFVNQYALSDSYSTQMVNVGLTWIFGGGGPGDDDGDGVLNVSDRCPDTPLGALVDKHDGCPWDLDQDGVMIGIDLCTDTPRGWPVDDQGCPLDDDEDAVPDGVDECPDTPTGSIVDRRGCPVDSDGDTVFDGIDQCQGTPLGAFVDPPDSPTAGCPHDSDGDDVFDGIDECVLTPLGATVNEKGCPNDSDGDRVLDGIDQCADTPQDQKIDRDGCPRVRLDTDESQILENVRFYGMELYPGSGAWLQLLIDAATYWYDIKFEIGIYTDSVGGPAANLNAARRRGEVVKGWLVEHGIDKSRIVMKPYGAVNFIADNETEVGQEKNRRVEVRPLSGNSDKHADRPPDIPDPELLLESSPPPPAEPEEQGGAGTETKQEDGATAPAAPEDPDGDGTDTKRADDATAPENTGNGAADEATPEGSGGEGATMEEADDTAAPENTDAGTDDETAPQP